MGSHTRGTAGSLTIGLLWHSINSDNFGIGALTASHIALVERIGRKLGLKAQFIIITWRDHRPAYISHPDLEVLALRTRDLIAGRRVLKAVRCCDLVLDISAGDSFADIYGVRRFLLNALGKVLVLTARKPLLLSPQTVGPFNRFWTRQVAGSLMRRARMVVSRDQLTTDFLSSFRLGAKLVEAVDVAFELPFEKPTRAIDNRIRFGMNVSGLLFNGGYTQNNMFALAANYPDLVRAILRHFGTLPNCELHLIPHVISDRNAIEDDYRVCERLASEFPGVIVAPRFDTPSDAKSYIAAMDFFCGSRMHACIAAFSSGVPVLPIAYSRKFAGVFQTVGYDWTADCRSEGQEAIIRKIKHAFEHRSDLKQEVAAGQKRAEEKLAKYGEVLQSQIESALGAQE